MDIRKVKKLIELMEESDIVEIEVKEGEDSVRISRGLTGPAQPMSVSETVASVAAVQTSDAVPGTIQPISITGHIIHAPMVGTFYRSPAPDAPAYVDLGATVRPGETLCIIEAMKLMNELECEVSGVIREICVENGEPVEFGQVLFRVSP